MNTPSASLAVAFVSAFLALALPACAATYRVDDLTRLQYYTLEAARPGDILEIAPGVHYLTIDRILVRRSGTPDAPIIIRGISDENGNRPVIDASRVNVHRAVFVVGDSVHDIVFENLEIRNSHSARFPNAVPMFGMTSGGAFFLAGCHNVTIRNCHIHDNNGTGLFATHWADCILIEDCLIHNNGTSYTGPHNASHNFYFCAERQIVRNCYIHTPTEGENFKSRAGNTIFAYNWVDEEAIYSVAVDSGGAKNTLWVGNVVMKRTELGHGQGRLLGVGDGTGVASGTLVALNNTFITIFPRDFYLFTERSSTADVVLLNNVFAGPGSRFLDENGKGSVTGRNNWIQAGIADVPDALQGTVFGDDPGFVDQPGFDFRLKVGSPLIDAGLPREEVMPYVRIVTDNARAVTSVTPSPIWLDALREIEESIPSHEPIRKGHGYVRRPGDGRLDIGAYEFVKPD